jgi:hypothetical protein
MASVKELSYQQIAFQLAIIEKEIQGNIARKKELLDELGDRADRLKELNRRGEIPFERSECE